MVRIHGGVVSITKEDPRGRSREEEWVRLTVEDNGIGFDEKYLDRIFTVFQRLHARTEYGGTGIGLAICRKIVERHGGSITARSTPGRGANFIVSMPLKQVGDPAHGASTDADHDADG